MPVGLVSVTHGRIGEELVQVACQILGEPALAVRHLPFDRCDDARELEDSLAQTVTTLDDGSGVLVLTDLYGATPCNTAWRLAGDYPVRVLSGINLPMVLRVLNYADLDLDTMARRAAEGGRIGIIDCGPEAD